MNTSNVLNFPSQSPQPNPHKGQSIVRFYDWSSGDLFMHPISPAHLPPTLDWTGCGWVDAKFSLIKNCLSRFDVVVTDQDLIAHEDYIERLAPDTIIIFYFTGVGSKFFKHRLGANENRLKKAQAKLKALGFKTRFFVSEKAVNNFLHKQAQK